MFKKVFQFLNDNHWFIVGGLSAALFLFWLYGCESKVYSLVEPTKKVNRLELQAETDFLIAKAKVKLADLDKQDELKNLILEQSQLFAQTGTLNPAGLVNLLVSIGAITFGLDRNQKLKAATKNNSTNST